ncbi:MAG: hypothetical protein ACI92I_000743 [Acidimicrobiales bacterium]|jgi:hypothetical protein
MFEYNVLKQGATILKRLLKTTDEKNKKIWGFTATLFSSHTRRAIYFGIR